MTQLNLLAGAYGRILKLARTLADLAEALQYGPKLMLS
jgi:predicted ATPase with chaperone activity